MSEGPGFTSGAGGIPTSVYDESALFPSIAASGLPGATAGARLAGGIVSGPPVTGTFGYLDLVPDGTGAVWVCTTAGSPGTWARAGGPGGTPALSQTAVQTANYTASANQLVPVSTASGAVTVTLPSAPPAGTLADVKLVTLGAGNAVTVACGGSDVFNKTGGGTSLILSLQGQGVLMQYQAGIWLVLSDDLPLSQIEALFVLSGGATMGGYLAPAGVTLAYGTTVNVNAALGNAFNLTLTASTATIANPANPADGQVIRFRIAQGSGGGFTVTWGSAYDFGSGAAPTLSATAGKVDICAFEYVASLTKWCCLGSGTGF
jgi:hypothetical protein